MENFNFQVFNHLAEAVVCIRLETNTIVYANNTYRKLFVEKEDFSTKFLCKVLSELPEFQDIYYNIEKLLAEKEEIKIQNVRMFGMDELKRYGNIRIGYIDDRKQTIYVIIQRSEDIDALRKIAMLLNDFVEPVTLIQLDDILTIKYTNIKFNEIFSDDEETLEKVYENGFVNLLVEEEREKCITAIKKQIINNKSFSIEAKLKSTLGVEHSVILCGVVSDKIANSPYENIIININLIDDKIELINLLKIEKNILHSLQEFTNNLMFKLNVKTKKMDLIGSVIEEYNIPNTINNFPEGIEQLFNFHYADKEKVIRFLNKMYIGSSDEIKFRLYTPRGSINWYKIKYETILDEDGHSSRVVGAVIDIQEQKELEEKLEKDELTGCLRKSCFGDYVDNYLRITADRGVLFLIDIDNFKAVNDNLGHQFGDTVLRGVGKRLNVLLKKDNLVGHVGGDEFMILIKGVSNELEIQTYAQDVLKVLNQVFEGNGHAYKISGSVGIASYPENGNRFTELYHKADMALYESKYEGKNRYTFYNEEFECGTMRNTRPLDIATRELSQHLDQQIVLNIFDMLFEAKDYNQAIQEALEIIGSRFGVDRCYIFEVIKGKEDYCRNSFEWCQQGVEPQIGELQELPIETITYVMDDASPEGLYYCNELSAIENEEAREILEMQGIKSFLHNYFKLNNKFTCMIGFDDCKQQRKWSPIEITTLLHVSRILVQFIEYHTVLDEEL